MNKNNVCSQHRANLVGSHSILPFLQEPCSSVVANHSLDWLILIIMFKRMNYCRTLQEVLLTTLE